MQRSAVALAVVALAASATPTHQAAIPRPDHVVLVVMENHDYGQIIGKAPYITSLGAGGALLTNSHGVTHPSEPNYLDLFSGTNQGVRNDSCPHTFGTDNQAAEMQTAGLTFTSYAEGLPKPGAKVCDKGLYARRHAPWTNFTNVPAASQQPFTSFPADYTTLPDVAWVVPNLCSDMHDCSVATGDAWVQANLGAYATWAAANNSLLIVTFDEGSSTNHIATVFYGAGVVVGSYAERVTHYNVLATMEDMYGVPRLGNAVGAAAVTDIWAG